jgi:hypothetical protein
MLQNTTRGFAIFADDSAAIGTGKTGLSITTKLRKNGGTENTVTPTISDLGGGWYWIEPISAHRDTLGVNLWTFSATGAIIAGVPEEIVAVDNRVSAFGAMASYTQPAGFLAATFPGTVASTSNVQDSADGIQNDLDEKLPESRLSRIDRLPDVSAGEAGGLSLVGSEMALTSANLTALFSDVDVAALVASVVANFDEATDLPVQTLAALAATQTVAALVADSGIIALIANAAAAKTAAESVDAKLTSPRLTQIDGAMQAGADNDTGKTLSDQIDGVSSGSGLDAAGVRAAIGMESANLDTQLDAIASTGGSLTSEQASQLDAIVSQTAKLSGAPVIINGNVKAGGQITVTHGDDHLEGQSNQITVPVSDLGGALYAILDGVGVENLSVDAIRGSDSASRISGTVAALAYALDVLSVVVEFTAAETSKGIVGPLYDYNLTKTGSPTLTYFSGKLRVARDAR